MNNDKSLITNVINDKILNIEINKIISNMLEFN